MVADIDARSLRTPGVPAEASATPCPFCADGIEDRAFAIADGLLALYNIAPVLPGHALVLPRRHAGSLLQLTDDELTALVLFARRVTRLLARAFRADGFDWTVQDGAAAGQTVPHLHLHILPRHWGDLPHPGDWYPALIASDTAHLDSHTRPRLTPAEHAQVTAYLRAVGECAEP